MDGRVEAQAELVLRDAQRFFGEDQVSGGGDGQELGQPLDDAEDDGLEEVGHVLRLGHPQVGIKLGRMTQERIMHKGITHRARDEARGSGVMRYVAYALPGQVLAEPGKSLRPGVLGGCLVVAGPVVAKECVPRAGVDLYLDGFAGALEELLHSAAWAVMRVSVSPYIARTAARVWPMLSRAGWLAVP